MPNFSNTDYPGRGLLSTALERLATLGPEFKGLLSPMPVPPEIHEALMYQQGLLSGPLQSSRLTPDQQNEMAAAAFDAANPSMAALSKLGGLLGITSGYKIPESLLKKLNDKYPDVDAYISKNDQGLILDKLQIAKDQRNKGLGGEYLNDVTSYADENNLKMALTAAGDYGGSKAGQQRFYRRHGFKPNKGRNKDFMFKENMIRDPVLPMDEASRMQRAKDMGFDVNSPLYHGTNANIESFDPELIGSTTDEGWLGKGFNFTPHADVAESYGNTVMPVYARMKNPFRFPEDVNPIKFVKEKGGSDGFTKWLSENGYDGVISDRVLHQTIVTDPKNIRSKFAKFDPAQSDSANILASMAGLGLLGAYAYPQDN